MIKYSQVNRQHRGLEILLAHFVKYQQISKKKFGWGEGWAQELYQLWSLKALKNFATFHFVTINLALQGFVTFLSVIQKFSRTSN